MDSFVFGVDENNNAALRVSPGQGETNQKDIFTTDENGNAAIRVIGAGGGGSVDYNRVIEKSSSIPAASSDNYRKVYMYVGDTNVTYTHGYIYECQKTSATYTGTVSFEAASLSGTTVTCDGDDFANFLTEAGADPTPIVSGTMTYDSGADGWRLVGKDADNNTVTSFIEYTEDYTDHGFVFTGTPVDGDVIGFTCSVSESSATYGWVRLDVQPAPSGLPDQTGQSGKFLTTDGTNASWATVSGGLPSQTGNAGKFLTTDGTDASWSDKPLVNSSTNTNALAIGNNTASGSHTTTVGASAWNSLATYGTSIGYNSSVSGMGSVAIGANAHASGTHSIQISTDGDSQIYNNDANTFKVANDNGNFEIMSADGTIPAARHASLPATDGTYVLKLVISGGVPTLSWVAE